MAVNWKDRRIQGVLALAAAALVGLGITYRHLTAPVTDPLTAGHTAYLDGDFPAAVRYLQPLADKGDPQAQDDIGNLHYSGHFLSHDLAEAAVWFRKAAGQGNVDAENNLGMMYASGKGVPKDLAIAVTWYRKAADQGDGLAQDLIADDYENGWGVNQDLVQSYMWFSLANNAGSENSDYQIAAAALGRLATLMSPQQIAEAQRLAAAFRPATGPAPANVAATGKPPGK